MALTYQEVDALHRELMDLMHTPLHGDDEVDRLLKRARLLVRVGSFGEALREVFQDGGIDCLYDGGTAVEGPDLHIWIPIQMAHDEAIQVRFAIYNGQGPVYSIYASAGIALSSSKRVRSYLHRGHSSTEEVVAQVKTLLGVCYGYVQCYGCHYTGSGGDCCGLGMETLTGKCTQWVGRGY